MDNNIIGPINEYLRVYRAQQMDNKDNTQNKNAQRTGAKNKGENRDSLELSGAAKKLKTGNLEEVRTEKVEEIKDKINQGNYTIDSGKIDESKIINFPSGMIGFQDYKKYLLLEDGEAPFWYLQSIEDENLFFILVNPLRFFPDYKVEIEKEKLSDIELNSPEQGAVLCPVTIPEGGVNSATANLKGPVIINTEKGLAAQVILHPSDYTTKHPLYQDTPQKKKASGEG